MNKIVLLLIASLIMISCVSIPMPRDEKEAMGILYTEFIKETDVEPFGSYVFTVSNRDGSYNKMIHITRDKVYFLNGLKPGKYDVSYKFVYTNSGKMGSNNLMFSFDIKEGMAQIIPSKIISKIYLNDEKKLYMTRYAEKLENLGELKSSLIEQYPDLSSWNW